MNKFKETEAKNIREEEEKKWKEYYQEREKNLEERERKFKTLEEETMESFRKKEMVSIIFMMSPNISQGNKC
jgi:hypothetical protein